MTTAKQVLSLIEDDSGVIQVDDDTYMVYQSGMTQKQAVKTLDKYFGPIQVKGGGYLINQGVNYYNIASIDPGIWIASSRVLSKSQTSAIVKKHYGDYEG